MTTIMVNNTLGYSQLEKEKITATIKKLNYQGIIPDFYQASW